MIHGLVTLEWILSRGNLVRAYQQVVVNKGAAGVDGMKVEELRSWFYAHPDQLTQSILHGEYHPQPIKRVYIPKDNGDKRPLGIPTVIDRFVQQAVAQVLSTVYEFVFSDNSYGYRPERGAQDAINKAIEYLNDGYEWVIDLDLSKFFDSVNHSKLLQILSRDIKDGRVISLIHKFLRAPVMEDGKVGGKTQIGTPQGGCISPVLANILLNELDQLLDERGIKFVRYADDMVIMTKSQKAAERVLANVTKYLEEKLFLKVNKDKTKISKASKENQFLGFTFTTWVSSQRKERNKNQKWFPTVHEKKRKKLIEKVKEVLDRRAKGGIQRVKAKLTWLLRGWTSYYGNAVPVGWARNTDRWIRRRIRQLLWKQWKTPQNRHREVLARWPKAPKIGEYAYSSNSYWKLSRTHEINTALMNQTLYMEGWATLEVMLTPELLEIHKVQ